MQTTALSFISAPQLLQYITYDFRINVIKVTKKSKLIQIFHACSEYLFDIRLYSNLKLRIIKRLKVHWVLSGLFHSGVGYMKMFLELCGNLNFCAVG
jgi:hypothetical protein